MKKIVWTASEPVVDERRYVRIVLPVTRPELIEWLEDHKVDSSHWTILPLWDDKKYLYLFFEEAVPLETVMLFKLTFG